jgi:class 3 adenylate cyclase
MSARERRRYGTYPPALMIPRTADEPNGCPAGHLTGRQIRHGQGRRGRLSAVADASTPQGQRKPATGSELTQRVADADRDRTVNMLREHVVEGRLTLDEFSERAGSALQAKTRGELDAVTADLPTPPEQRDRLAPSMTAPALSPRKSGRWHVAILSGHSTKGRWRIGGKTKAIAVMGGCELDLRQAEIEGPEVEISAVAFWGGIDIIVPEGFDVELRGFSLMGGRSLKIKDVPVVPGSPRIVVRGFAIMAGIEVKSRPNRTARTKSRRSDRRVGREVTDRPLGAVDPAAVTPPLLPTPPPPPPPSAPLSPPIAAPGSTWTLGADVDRDGTVTILFCDMVDYAGMTERLGDQASRNLLFEHHRIIREALVRHGGREINVQGDGFMVAFGGAARAMRCAIDIQRSLRDYVSPVEGETIAVHIGIHTGDALQERDDYLGHTVIVASRLADSAASGEIMVSSVSEQLVQGSGEFIFEGHRETRLKGLERTQPAAMLTWDD